MKLIFRGLAERFKMLYKSSMPIEYIDSTCPDFLYRKPSIEKLQSIVDYKFIDSLDNCILNMRV